MTKVNKEKSFDIWSEGFVITGGSSGAHYHGTTSANSFKEACDKYFKGDSLYDSERMTYWGCRLFDNSCDARKSFG